MKSLRKILAVLVATAMVAGMGALSFGAINERNWDRDLSVVGIDQSGATVTFYQVLKFSGTAPEAQDTKGWITGDDMKEILDSGTINKLTGSGTDWTLHQINFELATKIAGLISGTGITADTDTVSGTASATAPEPGLYVAIIKPGEGGWIYNPVFVAADFFVSGSSSSGNNSFTIREGSGSYTDEQVAKKDRIPLDKHITNQQNDNQETTSGSQLEGDADNATYHAANANDEISFKIHTVVPSFSKKYTNPTFVVTDTLDGLVLSGSSIGVYTDESGSTPLTKDPAYSGTYDVDVQGNTFVITFTKPYLYATRGPQPVYILYKANIASGSYDYNVTDRDNEVTVKYSNNPDQSGSSGTLRDRTKNYVFSIDANVVGQTGWLKSGTEIVKVALDADGNEITSGTGVVTINSGTDKVGALKGATFKWSKSGTPYDWKTGLSSDSEGRITLTGIDAGDYVIQEVTAPQGYVIDPNPYYISIIPTYERKHVVEESGAVVYDYDHLVSYEVKVNGNTTAVYQIDDSGTTEIQKATGLFTIGHSGPIRVLDPSGPASRYGKIQNTQGTALPATGGIGTTIFYAGGAILVLLAGILLVSKRRFA